MYWWGTKKEEKKIEFIQKNIYVKIEEEQKDHWLEISWNSSSNHD